MPHLEAHTLKLPLLPLFSQLTNPDFDQTTGSKIVYISATPMSVPVTDFGRSPEWQEHRLLTGVTWHPAAADFPALPWQPAQEEQFSGTKSSLTILDCDSTLSYDSSCEMMPRERLCTLVPTWALTRLPSAKASKSIRNRESEGRSVSGFIHVAAFSWSSVHCLQAVHCCDTPDIDVHV